MTTLTPCDHVAQRRISILRDDHDIRFCEACGRVLTLSAVDGPFAMMNDDEAQDHASRWMVDEGRWDRVRLRNGSVYGSRPLEPDPLADEAIIEEELKARGKLSPERARMMGISTEEEKNLNDQIEQVRARREEPRKIPQPRVEVEVHGTELTRYADRAMFEAEEMPDDMPRVYLLSATPDPLGALAAMSKMYKGEVVRDLAEVTDAEREHFWEESFKTHLKAPWESIDFHFLIEGVTRAFTHQMVRQRTAVFAQESMRFAVKEKIAARPGPLTSQNPKAKEAWDGAIKNVWYNYAALIGAGIPAEEARGLLPHDTLTRLHYKTNLRNLADHLGNRLCTQAQFEWRLVASQLRAAIRDHDFAYQSWEHGRTGNAVARSGWQFERIADSPIFRPVCFALGKCPFTAEFDRGCTIRERVDAGRFEEIETREWLADPTAGWVR